jgi:organic radical activating enzyme
MYYAVANRIQIIIQIIIETSQSKTFCPCPWTSLRLGVNGGTGICSYSENVGNNLQDPVDKILQNKLLSEIKTSIKNEEWHDHCSYCKDSETYGGRSERLMHVNSLDADVRALIDNNDQNVLTSCSINWNNLCNLTCLYCGPDCSTEWQKVKGKIIELGKVDEENAVNYLLDNQEHLSSITVGGGEPLLQKSIYKLFNNLSKYVNVHITTNLSVDLTNNPMFKSIISNKNINVHWMISFDCLEKRFEYVRHKAEWKTFVNNIDILKQHNQHIIAHPAYCLYSAFDLLDFYDFCLSKNLDIFWCDLINPYELDIRFAPESIRLMAAKEIDKVLTKYENYKNLSLDTLAKYKEMCYTGIPISNDVVNVEKVSNKQRAMRILSFNNRIEQELKKTTTFNELWSDVSQKLKEECNG